MAKVMRFSDGRVEYSFWGNVEYDTNEAAKAARDLLARELRTQTGTVGRKWVLRNQLRPYAGLGESDGRSGHVYKLTVTPDYAK